VYNIIIYIYLLGVAVASFFSTKVRKMWRGERDAFDVLRNNVEEGAQYVWFHAASLGEFEQGRPLIEELRHTHPQNKVLLTFFSPSGYEVRKNYEGADIVCYLPLDTPLNARRFLRLVRPVMAFFIKYEFWYNYLHILKHRGVPTYSVSSIFRPDQIFFRWYGKSYGKVLACFSHFFVQNEQSRSLLATIGIRNVSVTGDTRFDRVLQIQKASKHLPLIENFVQGKHLFVAGSSWPSDEEIFVPFFNARSDWKMIIAPHVVSEEHLQFVDQVFERINRAAIENHAEKDVVIMHPLPRDSRPGAFDLATDLDDLPNLAIFRQADNGVTMRMAIFAMVLDVHENIDRHFHKRHGYRPRRYSDLDADFYQLG